MCGKKEINLVKIKDSFVLLSLAYSLFLFGLENVAKYAALHFFFFFEHAKATMEGFAMMRHIRG